MYIFVSDFFIYLLYLLHNHYAFMKIELEGNNYETDSVEIICERFFGWADNFNIEQCSEKIYRTSDGKFFKHVWHFYDWASRIAWRDCSSEYIRGMDIEEVVDWFRHEALETPNEYLTSTFYPIGTMISELSSSFIS